MTQDEIIRMALEHWPDFNSAFSAGIAYAERDIEAAVLAEREACAKVCEKMAPRTVCAAAIRARGEK